ncbi:unnamed protein product [Phytophthora fragariaefolia]|uniref:Unnamed protein product n=1 Tax=Phytophthora fragariaefolia TaxID=1490495 RepID=A0A9W7CYR1_9STRA|nr:unnamed protein product [Phytophthora fragariaefolia]
MAFTLHCVDEGFVMCSWTLEVEAFPGMHTDSAIARGLEDMSERWQLHHEMCTLLLRDGASNAVLGSDILGVKNMSCIAHSVYRVLGGALARQKGDSAFDFTDVSDADESDQSGARPALNAITFEASQSVDDDEVVEASDLKQEAARSLSSKRS